MTPHPLPPPDVPDRPSDPSTSAKSPTHRLNLALQGGGSHGAFTWGVLDRLLEEDGLVFNGISGTSAGALNAAVMATGFAAGGRDAARQALRNFWMDVSRSGAIFSPLSASSGSPSSGGGFADSFKLSLLPGYQWVSSFFRSFSPYEFNPLNLNPLREVVQRHVDQVALRDGSVRLFITATSVNTGQGRVFSGDDLSIDALMASACLPHLFQAVMIDGEGYWDGGYTGNPALYPLIYETDVLDVMLVRINPLVREGVPKRTEDILDRLSEITFNASLIGEMRAISLVSRLVREGKLDPGRYKDLRLHMVADDEGLSPLGAASKFNTDAAFLEGLFELGRGAAAAWLGKHRHHVGAKSTLNIEREFLAVRKPAV